MSKRSSHDERDLYESLISPLTGSLPPPLPPTLSLPPSTPSSAPYELLATLQHSLPPYGRRQNVTESDILPLTSPPESEHSSPRPPESDSLLQSHDKSPTRFLSFHTPSLTTYPTVPRLHTPPSQPTPTRPASSTSPVSTSSASSSTPSSSSSSSTTSASHSIQQSVSPTSQVSYKPAIPSLPSPARTQEPLTVERAAGHVDHTNTSISPETATSGHNEAVLGVHSSLGEFQALRGPTKPVLVYEGDVHISEGEPLSAPLISHDPTQQLPPLSPLPDAPSPLRHTEPVDAHDPLWVLSLSSDTLQEPLNNNVTQRDVNVVVDIDMGRKKSKRNHTASHESHEPRSAKPRNGDELVVTPMAPSTTSADASPHKKTSKSRAGQTLYRCDAIVNGVQCGKQFRWQRDLRRHLRIHTGEKPFTCQHCTTMDIFRNQSFVQKGSLTVHLRRKHSSHPEKLKCDYPGCTATFTRKHSLQLHKRIHTNEKPYQCETCGKRFRVKHNYVTHTRIHSKTTPYQCSYCLRQFTDKSNLNKHTVICKRKKGAQIAQLQQRTHSETPSPSQNPSHSTNPSSRNSTSTKQGPTLSSRPLPPSYITLPSPQTFMCEDSDVLDPHTTFNTSS